MAVTAGLAGHPAGPATLGYARAAELVAAGHPFAFATVVAVRRPTSARPGAHGIVHPDGSIEGWVGGSCAQPVVVREALRSLADGQPRLLRLSKDAPAEGRRGDGVIELVMTCHSGGTLEIAVEPVLPAPALWVAGTTPIAGALVSLGAAAGFRVTLVDPIADASDFPAAIEVVQAAGLSLPLAGRAAIRGGGDAGPVGRGGGRRSPAAGRRLCRARRVPDPRRDRPGVAAGGDRPGARAGRRPARAGGHVLGAETAEEIALSILAELIQVRHGRAPFIAAPGPATLAGEELPVTPLAPVRDDIVLLDPVCGMTVDAAHARHLAEHAGTIYAFCSIGCRTRFVKDPATYLSPDHVPSMPGSSPNAPEAT